MRKFHHAAIIFSVFTALLTTGCNRKPEPAVAEKAWPAFDQKVAYEDVGNLAAFGSRAVGTAGHRHAEHYVAIQLKTAGLNPVIQTFTNTIAGENFVFRNISATIPGSTTNILLITTHYDGLQQATAEFQSANSSASGPAVLLEIARVLKAGYSGNGPEIRLVFFDGQEPVFQHGYADGLQGSRYYARQLAEQKKLKSVQAVINLDMVGDRDLTVTLPKNVSLILRKMLLAAAHKENARQYFRLMPMEIGDDHESFLHYKIPSINIIDFEYGSAPGQNDYWRTEADTLDKISAESLDVIGRVTLRLIRDLVSPRLPES